jgi:shikimate dehydrogenase
LKQFTIYGNPVEHSKSPQMHNSGFALLNIDANYSKTLLQDGNTIKDEFLKNGISGANITVPHKENGFKNADILDEFAKQIGAVNTYIRENGKVKAYNTDAPGFYKAIEEFKSIKSVLLIGAGGTAKAIAVILRHHNIAVDILNRSENSKDFFRSLKCNFYTTKTINTTTKYHLIVNSTSAGLKDENYPTTKEILTPLLKNSTYAFDCIYGKMTPFLNLAKQFNIQFKDGEDMLLFQGVLAFELFTNTKATDKLIEAMRDGLKSS